jgi:dihydrodipicolinate synthase/N-acetylneuraminate lyase
MIKGIFTPHLVPFTDKGAVNEAELRRLINWLIEKGVNGLYPNGSTGEFIRLSPEERRRIVKIVVEEARGRVPVMAGAAEPNIDMIIEAAKEYRDLGCIAISVTAPYYHRISGDSVEQFFRELVGKTPIDIVLYNIPQYCNEIPLQSVKRLAEEFPRIVGIKDSSKDFIRFLTLLRQVKAVRPGFSIMSGCEEVLLPAMFMGADGGTVAVSGIVPEALTKFCRLFSQQKWDEARELQFKLLELITLMHTASNFPDGFRAALSTREFNLGKSRQPISRDEEATLQRIRDQAKPMIAALVAE